MLKYHSPGIPDDRQRFVYLGTTVNWICIALVLLIFLAGDCHTHSGLALLLICAASIYNIIMQYLPWNSNNYHLMFRIWIVVDLLLLAGAIPVTGGMESKAVYVCIPVLLMARIAYQSWETVVISLVVSIVYTMEIVYLHRSIAVFYLLQHLGGIIPLFFLANIIAAFTMGEVKKQTLKRESYEILAGELKTRLQQLQAVNQLSSAANSLQLDELLDATLNIITDLFHEPSIIMLYDQQKNVLKLAAQKGLHDNCRELELELGEGINGQAAREQTIAYFANTAGRETSQLFTPHSLIGGMAIPLIAANQLLGTFCITSRTRTEFKPDEKFLLTMLMERLSITLYNISLYDNSQQQARQFYDLFETARTINTLSSLPEILNYSCHRLKKIAGDDAVFIALQRKNQTALRITSLCGLVSKGLIGRVIDMHDGAGYKAFNSQQAVLMNDVDHDPVNELLDNPGSIKSLLVLPIIYRYKAFGIIYLLSFQHSPHTPHSLNLAAAIASIIGIACDNLNLLDSLNQQVQNLTDLMDIASAVQGSLKQDEILHAIVEKSYRRFSAHTCQINLVHKAENWLEIAAFKGFTPRITGRINDKKIYRYTSSCPALRGGGARVYTARNACPGFHSHGPVKSYLCAPLAVGEEIFGVIHLTSLQENAYGPDDLTFLASFAREAGMAVQRGRLYEALAMEKLKIETIIKSIDDPLVVLDGRGTMIMANTAFYYYFAINPSGNDGRDLAQLISESPYTVSIEPHDYKSLLNNVLHNTRSLTITCTVTSNRNIFYNHITLTPIINGRQEATGIVVLFHDVSELQELLQRMNQEKENAEKANILKTEFIATISHELRTPLNSIIGYTQCLLDEIDGPLNPEQLSDLDKVLHNAENLLRLINDILDLSRLELDNTGFIYEDLAIGPLVSEAIKTIKPLADARGLKIYTELDNAARVKSDAFRLQQVLVNLLSNAVKFTHVGHITVTADQNTVPGYVTFSIADTGIGFEPQAQEYIFDRFRQADGSITRKYGGTGLGLSICKSLVHLLGGNIWASSQPGMGSTFYFTIPRERPSGSREDEENCLYDD